ncbi:MAG: 16S rRNA (guanine(527)-N(7))-methyltransferase RsmG [bacterium]|nr:16S rRNA (guanine(527)-N(7))-methyltransferase RsmG [bacterium]
MESVIQHAKTLFGIELSADQLAMFQRYADELTAWNVHTNLTAIIEPQAVAIRHFLDSLSLYRLLQTEASQKIIDVGTGAGFPGMVLAILLPQHHFVLLEATGKKIKFLDHVIGVLGLKNAQSLHARAEDAGQMPNHRAKYDMVMARAVARLPALLEYMLPLAKVGGVCIAMKGVSAQTELDDSKVALKTLGGRFNTMQTVMLPTVEEPHHLVFVEKIAKTPIEYPRKPGIPAKKPLI